VIGTQWNADDSTITLEVDGQRIYRLRPDSAFRLVVMAASMLRGYGTPYPYTSDERERIALGVLREHVEGPEAEPVWADLDGLDREAVRDALDGAARAVAALEEMINILRTETGT
jgi:hypothetical protein